MSPFFFKKEKENDLSSTLLTEENLNHPTESDTEQTSTGVFIAAEPPAKKQRFSVYTGETFLRFILDPKSKIHQTKNNFLFSIF